MCNEHDVTFADEAAVVIFLSTAYLKQAACILSDIAFFPEKIFYQKLLRSVHNVKCVFCCTLQSECACEMFPSFTVILYLFPNYFMNIITNLTTIINL